jgi:hypothetical protein
MKSTLKLKPFKKSSDESELLLTRIVSIEHAIDFIVNNQIHFSPFSAFKDYTEGKRLFECIDIDDEFDDYTKTLSPKERRKVLYASCWIDGDENLNMWDIYGKSEKHVAIQINREELINKFFNTGAFEFKSETLNKSMPNSENKNLFKPSSFYYGNIEYIELQTLGNQKLYLGRFKDNSFKHENEFRFLLRQNYRDNTMTNLYDLKCVLNQDEFKKFNIKVLTSPYASEATVNTLKKNISHLHTNIKIESSKFKDFFS